MIKIIADNKIPFLEGLFDGIAEIKFFPAKEITNEIVKNADALITRTRTKCNEELLKNSKVKFIASATIGFDHIDTEYCHKNNIQWTNAPGCNSSSVEQYIHSALLNLAQKHHFRLAGKTLGIIGVGNVGKKVKELAKNLNMHVLLNDPPRKKSENLNHFVEIDEIIEQADIISIHTPLIKKGNDKTFHLVDTAFLKKTKKNVFIINTARGEIIDNSELKSALKLKQIAGAILDVWENEPNIDSELLDLLSFGTPHIAGYSADGKANGTLSSFKAICDFFNLTYDANITIDIPRPEQVSFTINCKNKNIQQIRTEKINHSYNILNDDSNLRKEISKFEYLRNNYPIRRELPIFNFILSKIHVNNMHKL